MKLLKYILAVLIVQTAAVELKAQTLPVGTTALEDYYRRQQLLGEVDSAVSFTIRPLVPQNQFHIRDFYFPDSLNRMKLGFKSDEWNPIWKLRVRVLPVSILSEYNSRNPYGWNDGPMIPAKGLQTLLSGGFYLQAGFLSIQFRPEAVLAANKPFDTFNKDHFAILAAWYHDFYNNIDLPARFGEDVYNKTFWGQSSIRLNYKSVSFGLSTENLWWGPGVRNSLLMSNDAPGFAHLTLNTTKPVQTFVGSFEGQLIAGQLKNSNFSPLLTDWENWGIPEYVPKPDRRRYLSGLVLTWHPKWVTGLFLGLTRSAQVYRTDMSGFKDYFPFFNHLEKITADNAIDNKKDTRSSIFARWLWPEEHAEVYFEFGHNNYKSTLRNEFLEPQDSRAYIVGLRKIVPFANKANGGILIGAEVTQLAETSSNRVADAQSWYLNKYIRQGYTNLGQSLGAGIGPGGNLQSVEISWVNGLKKIGLQVERLIHNDDFYYYAYADSQDWRRHWVDLSAGINSEWNFKNFIFNVKVLGTKSLNYQWYLDPSLTVYGGTFYTGGKNVYNVQLQTGLTYRF